MLNVSALDRNFLYRTEQLARRAPSPRRWTSRRACSTAGLRRLLYARVDLVRLDEGWALMELELAEPSLFLASSPEPRSPWPAIERRAR